MYVNALNLWERCVGHKMFRFFIQLLFKRRFRCNKRIPSFCRDLSSVDFEECAEPSEEHLSQNN
jgi:hypothetical protein